MRDATREPRKILWAVDAFPDSPDVQAQAGRAVRTLAATAPALIQPIYIARPAPFELIAPQDRTWDKEFLRQANENLQWLFKLVDLPDVAPTKFLYSAKTSLGSQVKALLEYAEKEEFDWIVVGTHSRKGVPRLFLGSFAERLILQSPIPVLVANAHMQLQVGKFKNVLFPTDFSDDSSEVFDKVIAFAKNIGADIHLFHHEEYIEPQFIYPFDVPAISQTTLEEIHTSWKKLGEKWIERGTKAGVKTKFYLTSPGVSSITEITKLAEELPECLIAMASQSNVVESAILGSITRQVIRSAPTAVYVLHPDKKHHKEKQHDLSEGDLPSLRTIG